MVKKIIYGDTEFDTDVEDDIDEDVEDHVCSNEEEMTVLPRQVDDILETKITNIEHNIKIIQSQILSLHTPNISMLPKRFILSWYEITIVLLVLLYTLQNVCDV